MNRETVPSGNFRTNDLPSKSGATSRTSRLKKLFPSRVKEVIRHFYPFSF
jgi:hypothetical protein